MKRLLCILLVLTFAPSAFAWGPKGHDIVAYIAECNLRPRVKAKVQRALGGQTLTYYSSWMDNIRKMPQYAHTATWHYANVDEGESYDSMPKNPAGDVLTAVEMIVADLKSGRLTPQEEDVYLRFLIHLIGDMHCPMHTGRLSDLGGNNYPVVWFGQLTSLHSVWDDQMVESAHKWSYTEWRREIDRASKREREAIAAGTPRDWLLETVEICKELYEAVPEGARLAWDYRFENTPLLESQLRKGGYRLARLLNEIYR